MKPRCWTFYGFDWGLFFRLEERLRGASASGDFGAITEEGAAATLAELEADLPPAEVAGALLADLCCLGEPVEFGSNLAEFVLRIRRHAGGEEPAILLGKLISAGPGLQDWFGGHAAPAGILCTADTAELARGLEELRRHWRPPEPRGLARWTRRFAAEDPPEARLLDLMRLVDEARAGDHGLAVLCER